METVYAGITEKLMLVYDKIWNTAPAGLYHLETSRTKPDSIGYGSLGTCFFALELYKNTGEQKIIDDLTGYLQKLEKYMQANKTNNYSYFNGRTGVAALYLHLFRATGNTEWLARCKEIIRAYWNNDAGHLKIFDYKGLVNGAAGMVLFYLDLYSQIREEWLVDYIRQCMLDIISKAGMAQQGVYWAKDFYEDDGQSLWMHDCHAVAFCCTEAGKLFKSKTLQDFGNSSFAYTDNEKLVAANSCYGKTIGDMLVRMQCAVLPGTASFADDIHQLARFPGPLLSGDIPCNLYYGMAGWGLGFKEAYNLTQNTTYLQAAHKIAAVLEDRLLHTVDIATDLSFFTGLSGIGYALLKIAETNGTPSLMLPRIHINDNHYADSGSSFLAGPPHTDRSVINRLLVQVNFKETALMLKESAGASFHAFLNTHPLVTPGLLQAFISSLPAENQSQELGDIFERELICTKLKQEHANLVDDDLLYAQRADTIFRTTAPELMPLHVVESGKFYILKREPVIDLSQPVSAEILGDLFGAYGSRSHFMKVDNFNKMQIQKLNIRRLYVDHFARPASVASMADLITNFVDMQDDQTKASMVENMEVASVEALKEVLVGRYLETVRWLLAFGVLEIVPAASHL